MSRSSERALRRWRLARPSAVADGALPGSRGLGWRPDSVALGLFPDRLVLARAGGGWRHPLLQRQEWALPAPAAGAPTWQPAVDALAARLAEGGLARARVSLVLSSHFVHYTLVPWSTLLRSEAEQQAYARERFIRIHGPAAQGWDLRLSRSPAGQSRVACAVAPALHEALKRVMAPIGRRYVSLQPHLMASFNRWHRQLEGRARWLAVHEPGLLCLALLQGGQWRSVRALKLRAPEAGHLAAILQRERQLGDHPHDSDVVALDAAPASFGAALAQGPWTVEPLRGGRPARARSADEAALAAALEA